MLAQLLAKLVRRGQLTLIQANGRRDTYGPGGGQSVSVRFTDRRVPFDLIRNPRLAATTSRRGASDPRTDIGVVLIRMDVVMTPQHEQKGRSLYGPALFARSPVPEMDPVVSDDRTVKSFSNLGFGFSSFA